MFSVFNLHFDCVSNMIVFIVFRWSVNNRRPSRVAFVHLAFFGVIFEV